MLHRIHASCPRQTTKAKPSIEPTVTTAALSLHIDIINPRFLCFWSEYRSPLNTLVSRKPDPCNQPQRGSLSCSITHDEVRQDTESDPRWDLACETINTWDAIPYSYLYYTSRATACIKRAGCHPLREEGGTFCTAWNGGHFELVQNVRGKYSALVQTYDVLEDILWQLTPLLSWCSFTLRYLMYRKSMQELIEKLSLEKNMKILDLGCGTGYICLLCWLTVWDQRKAW